MEGKKERKEDNDIVHSIIIPFYNRWDLLERAVLSVLWQTAWSGDVELILVDDGSDSTFLGGREIPDWLEKVLLLPNVTYFRQSHTGVSSARNRGVGKSRGEYLYFLDSDDEWKPGKLAEQIQFHKLHPSIRISQTEEDWIRNGKFINPQSKHKKLSGDIFRESLMQCMITPSSVCMEKSLYLELGGMDEDLPACEDYDFWLGITSSNDVGLIRNKSMIRYAGHSDQLSFQYPVMDRFRIYSLIKRGQDFPEAKRVLARDVLIEKLEILIQGKKKRKKDFSVLSDLYYWTEKNYLNLRLDFSVQNQWKAHLLKTENWKG